MICCTNIVEIGEYIKYKVYGKQQHTDLDHANEKLIFSQLLR